jgi:hypothetical protein
MIQIDTIGVENSKALTTAKVANSLICLSTVISIGCYINLCRWISIVYREITVTYLIGF